MATAPGGTRLAVQYFVMVEDSKREELEKVHAKKVTFQAQLDSDAASRLARMMVSPSNLAATPSPVIHLDGTGNVNTPGVIPAAVPSGEGGDPADTAARKVHAQMQAALAKAKEVEQRREDRKRKLAQEKEQKQKDAEDFKATPAGLATRWLKDGNKELDNCATALVGVKIAGIRRHEERVAKNLLLPCAEAEES